MTQIHPTLFVDGARVYWEHAGVRARTIQGLLEKLRRVLGDVSVADHIPLGAPKYRADWSVAAAPAAPAEPVETAVAPPEELPRRAAPSAAPRPAGAERAFSTSPPARSALPSQEELDRLAAEYEVLERRRKTGLQVRRAKPKRARTVLTKLDVLILDLWSRGLKTFDVVHELKVPEHVVSYALVKGRQVGDPRAAHRKSAEDRDAISAATIGRPKPRRAA